MTKCKTCPVLYCSARKKPRNATVNASMFATTPECYRASESGDTQP